MVDINNKNEQQKLNFEKIFNYIYYFFLVILIIWLICFRTDIWLHKEIFIYDEMALLRNIQERSFFGLFKILGCAQCCPSLFLVLGKIVYNITGKEINELALCFIPYLTGVFSIILIPFLSNKIFKNKTFSFLFLIIFAYNFEAVFQSQMFKQYSSDIFLTILILYLFLLLKDKIKEEKHFLLIGITFGILGYFSFTSEFTIFPIFLYFLSKLIKSKKTKSILLLSVPYFSLLLTEFLLLIGIYRNTLGLVWRENIDPIFSSFYDISLLFAEFTTKLIDKNIIFLIFIIGIIVIIKKDKLLSFLLLSPFLFNLITQLLGIYPFPSPTTSHQRAVCYLIPIIIIICLKGIEAFEYINNNKITKYTINSFIIIFCIFLLQANYKSFDTYKKNNFNILKSTYAKTYIEILNKQKIKNQYLLVMQSKEVLVFDMYTNFKYKDQIIYTLEEENNVLQLNKIRKNIKICIFNYGYKINNLTQWLDENAKIIIHEKDDLGDFYYVEKIK